MHIKMHERTSKLARNFSGVVSTCPFNRGVSENGERARVERRGEGKEKVEGMTEGRGRKEGMWNSDGGGLNCATAPRGGDRRHCQFFFYSWFPINC